MTSRSFAEGTFLPPESSSGESIEDTFSHSRHFTVYDAVAGNLFILSTVSGHSFTYNRQDLRNRIHSQAPISDGEQRYSKFFFDCATSGDGTLSKQESTHQIRRVRYLLRQREAIASWLTGIRSSQSFAFLCL